MIFYLKFWHKKTKVIYCNETFQVISTDCYINIIYRTERSFDTFILIKNKYNIKV